MTGRCTAEWRWREVRSSTSPSRMRNQTVWGSLRQFAAVPTGICWPWYRPLNRANASGAAGLCGAAALVNLPVMPQADIPPQVWREIGQAVEVLR